jgi:hypothetical protein
MSAEDIEAGARWSVRVADGLSQTKFGIICVTPGNQKAPWLLFEAGALAKTLDDTHVCPYLIGLTQSQIEGGPLAQFQAKEANEQQTWELVRSINRAIEHTILSEDRLKKIFERWWDDLAKALKKIPKSETQQETHRPMSEMMEEVLSLTRAIARLQSSHYSMSSSQFMQSVFNLLSPKEERILRHRFGLGDYKPTSLKEVAATFGEQPTVISRIENNALRQFFIHCLARLGVEAVEG